MNLLIITIIVSVIICALLAAAINVSNKSKKTTKTKYGLALLGLIVVPIALFFGSITKVDANEVGIIYDDRKGVLAEVKYEGFQFKSIFEHITKISTANKTKQIEVAGQTQDSAYATFIITINYQIEANNAGLFYKKTSDIDINIEQLNSIVKEALQSSTIKYEIYGILGEELETVRLEFVKSLTKTLNERYHITLISASFDDVDAGQRIEEIIRNKAEAMQEIEIAKALQEKQVVDAETARIKAEAEAEVKKIHAEADAYAQEKQKSTVIDMIESTYEKYQADLTYEQCAEIVLQIVFIQSWDGVLPQVLTSDSLSALIGSLING